MKRIIFTESQMKMVLDNIIEEQVGFEKQDDVSVIVSTKDPKHVKNFATRKLSDLVRRAGLFWDNKTNKVSDDPESLKEFNKTVSQMKSMMDETSAQIFDSMLTKNPNFYYYVIAQFKGGVLGGQVKNKKIVVDNQTTIKQEMVSPGQEGKEVEVPIVEEGYQIYNPPGEAQGTLFAFNEATLRPEFTQWITTNILEPLDEGIKNMTDRLQKDGRGVVDIWVNKLVIKSSCSTIPNGKSVKTFPGKVPTFKELADARANVVYQYITKELQKRKAKFNQAGITIDSNGTNAGQMITIKNGNQMIEVDGTGTSGEAYVGQDKGELIKNQRVDLVIEYAVRGTTPPQSKTVKIDPIPPQFAPVEVNDFIVRFTATGRNIFKFRPNLNIQIRLPKLRWPFSRGKGIPCPKF